ncbi:unnamed protein product [Lupinus luteus]|uniref:C3H1-type domain-containing protein n=1 Tax=Lupinus luteus TaxID=3873 RepID=A0AAV1VY30_LUPLU
MFTASNDLHYRISVLLEFSAANDVKGFKNAIEEEGHDVDEVGLWYGRRVGSKDFGYEERTPLMVAAMFGSKDVLSYILGTGGVDVNRACGSDGAAALHCAVSGGSANSPEIIKLLVDASADVNAVDANGNRPSDLTDFVFPSIFNPRRRILEAILEGRDGGFDEACLTFDKADGEMVRMQQHYIDAHRVPKEGTEKKVYSVDVSLPDIKDGIYSTDEFRMYTFKVKPCSRAYSHDWTECPFVHPGENARRRDPLKYNYSCVPCPEFKKGLCSKGDACDYAHGIFECWLHPAQYRTRLCKDEAGCTRRVCFFAHKLEELRPLYASTGSAMPSPKSYSATASSLEIGSLSPFTPSSPPASVPPLSPSGSASPLGRAAMWQTSQFHVAVPTLHLAGSRLKTASNARDVGLGIELPGPENRQLMQNMLYSDEMAELSSPSKWKNTKLNSPSFHDSFDGDAGELNRNQQLRGYSSNVIGSPFSLNSRNAAFSKRSQSFMERSVVSHNSEPSIFSGWGSPDGKLDWGIRGEELNKLRKSASFGFGGTSSPLLMAATTSPLNVDEPDVSWVHSLVKDAPPMETGQYSIEEELHSPQRYLNNGTDVVPAWLEQLYMEQEQMVA